MVDGRAIRKRSRSAVIWVLTILGRVGGAGGPGNQPVEVGAVPSQPAERRAPLFCDRSSWLAASRWLAHPAVRPVLSETSARVAEEAWPPPTYSPAGVQWERAGTPWANAARHKARCPTSTQYDRALGGLFTCCGAGRCNGMRRNRTAAAARGGRAPAGAAALAARSHPTRASSHRAAGDRCRPPSGPVRPTAPGARADRRATRRYAGRRADNIAARSVTTAAERISLHRPTVRRTGSASRTSASGDRPVRPLGARRAEADSAERSVTAAERRSIAWMCPNGDECRGGVCVRTGCVPITCDTMGGRFCRTIGDGCGGTLTCGDCPGGAVRRREHSESLWRSSGLCPHRLYGAERWKVLRRYWQWLRRAARLRRLRKRGWLVLPIFVPEPETAAPARASRAMGHVPGAYHDVGERDGL